MVFPAGSPLGVSARPSGCRPPCRLGQSIGSSLHKRGVSADSVSWCGDSRCCVMPSPASRPTSVRSDAVGDNVLVLLRGDSRVRLTRLHTRARTHRSHSRKRTARACHEAHHAGPRRAATDATSGGQELNYRDRRFGPDANSGTARRRQRHTLPATAVTG